ncbi:MAG: hypothetical protein HY049_01460 [Acidobacteria bacterium]|nr:hypothetical protein [Acidobacteriota bacterium]
MRHSLTARLITVSLACIPIQTWAAMVPAGPEFQANTYVSYGQTIPVVAINTAGDFVVIWNSRHQDGSGLGLFGRWFDDTGSPRGPEFPVTGHTSGDQANASIALDAAGSMVVAWESYGEDGSMDGVFGRRFDASGDPLDSEFQVNVFTTDLQNNPSIAVNPGGDFVVAWQSEGQDGSDYGIFARRFDSTGTPRGAEFQVNTYTTNRQRQPAVALDAAGNFVMAWESDGQDGSGFGVFGRRFDSSGVPLGSEFQVNSYTTNNQRYPSIAADSAGDFVVVWHSLNQDGSMYGIFAQRFDSDGSPQGAEFQCNSYTPYSQAFASISMNETGDFIVVWHSQYQDGSDFGVYGRKFDRTGSPVGSDFQINGYTTGSQFIPSIAANDAGHRVVAWQSFGQDGDDFGVFVQRFARNPSVIAPRPGDLLDCTDPNLYRPTVKWDADGYDRFRVVLSPYMGFSKRTSITSGDTLLRTTSYTLPPKKWRNACAGARAANPVAPTLFIQVLGVDQDLSQRDAARRKLSPIVQVSVTPGI